MSIQNAVAKIYLRYFIRKENEFDSLKTQREETLFEPPKGLTGRCEEIEIGDTKSFWIDRENAEKGVLVYLHGGAFYFGPVKEHWQYIAKISQITGMAAVMVGYRLAPLYPFPTGFNDIIDIVSSLNLPPNWFFLGDSSGSGMAISVTFKLRELNRSLPKKLVLMSPWVDVTLDNPAIDLNKHEDAMMTVERLSKAAAEYAAHDDKRNPLISPMFADVDDLPPTLIQMGTADLLLWDCRKFYQKCLDARVAVTYEEYPHAFHDFMMAGFLPEARKALKSQAEFLTA